MAKSVSKFQLRLPDTCIRYYWSSCSWKWNQTCFLTLIFLPSKTWEITLTPTL